MLWGNAATSKRTELVTLKISQLNFTFWGFRDWPLLAQASVDAEVSGAAEFVALSGLRVGVAEVALGGDWVLEQIRIAVGIDELAGLWLGAVQGSAADGSSQLVGN